MVEEAPRIITDVGSVFGTGRYRHPCYAGYLGLNDCRNVMVVPDDAGGSTQSVLMDGDIHACIKCGARHEYTVLMKAGGVREGQIKLLLGVDRRETYEPTVQEFIPKEMP